MRINDRFLTRTLTPSLIAAAISLATATAFGEETKGAETKAAEAAQTETTERETLIRFGGWDDPDMARVAIHGGRALLRNIEAAHTALEENKLGEARSDLRSAADFADGLTLMIPYTVVVDHVRNAKHELLASTKDLVLDDLLPIYASIDEMAAYAPDVAAQAKGKLDEAVKHGKQGDKEKAAQKLDEVAADIAATTVYLPVGYVAGQVSAANAALNKDPADTATAKGAIDKAMTSLVDASFNLLVLPEDQGKAKPGSKSQGSQGHKEAGAKAHAK